MKVQTLFRILLALLPVSHSLAQNDCTPERTLRIDYEFAGNAQTQHISVDELCSFKGWAGRTIHMDSVPLRGNGDITLRDARSHQVIYTQSFSTLFQEWLATEEAVHTSRSFENVFLLPMPQDSAYVTIRLFNDKNGRVTTALTHRIDPNDILIRQLDRLPVPPHKYLHQSGAPSEKIDVAILAEGYTSEEMDAFYRDAQAAVEAILSHAPFKQMADRFNFVAVASPSADSDVSIPLKGLWRNTAVSSNFSTFYSDRYLTTLHLRDMHNLLAGIPYEHIIVLANTDTYGGGGIYNSYMLTTTHHAAFCPVVVHEFGHSFAGLADEYFYDDQYENYYSPQAEPWEQNITTLKDFSQKWSDMLPKRTSIPTTPTRKNLQSIGVYEGGGYMSHGVYRAFQDCRMKTNECSAFCAVCQRAISRMIEFYSK